MVLGKLGDYAGRTKEKLGAGKEPTYNEKRVFQRAAYKTKELLKEGVDYALQVIRKEYGTEGVKKAVEYLKDKKIGFFYSGNPKEILQIDDNNLKVNMITGKTYDEIEHFEKIYQEQKRTLENGKKILDKFRKWKGAQEIAELETMYHKQIQAVENKLQKAQEAKRKIPDAIASHIVKELRNYLENEMGQKQTGGQGGYSPRPAGTPVAGQSTILNTTSSTSDTMLSGTATYTLNTTTPETPQQNQASTAREEQNKEFSMKIGGKTVTESQVREYEQQVKEGIRQENEKLDRLVSATDRAIKKIAGDVDLDPQDEAEEEIYDAWRAIEEARADVPEESGYSSRKRGGRKVQEQHATVFATSLAVLGGVTGTMLIANAVSQTGPAGHATATAISMAPQLALFLIVGGLAGLAAGALHLSKQENR